jgi:hypothetical protein
LNLRRGNCQKTGQPFTGPVNPGMRIDAYGAGLAGTGL